MNTRLGPFRRRISKTSQGGSSPSFLESQKTTGKALTTVIHEDWFNGASTRRVDGLAQPMGLSRISTSQTPKLCTEIEHARVPAKAGMTGCDSKGKRMYATLTGVATAHHRISPKDRRK